MVATAPPVVYQATQAGRAGPGSRGLIRGHIRELLETHYVLHGSQMIVEPLAAAIVRLARPVLGDRVLEPACTVGSLLGPLSQTPADIVALEGAYVLAGAARVLYPRLPVHHLDLLDAWHWADSYAQHRGALAVLEGDFDLAVGRLPPGPVTLPPSGYQDLVPLSGRPTVLPLGEPVPRAIAYLEVVVRLLRPGGRAVLVVPQSLNGWWARLADLGPLTLVGEIQVPGALLPHRKRHSPRVVVLRRDEVPNWVTRRVQLNVTTTGYGQAVPGRAVPDLRRLLLSGR
ncbi:MAG: hypothetical protein KKA73_18370 [Chloroflexi bacterium]|nr:hypothetical protein [Chloroflexota bacterium]MBU1749653.1 hypothetical protein [Chloroflexota bacterium]